jgi:hypothetical protein
MTEFAVSMVISEQRDDDLIAKRTVQYFRMPISGNTFHWRSTYPFVVDELIFHSPDLEHEIRQAEERGRQDILSKFRKQTLDEILQMLNPDDYEYED